MVVVAVSLNILLELEKTLTNLREEGIAPPPFELPLQRAEESTSRSVVHHLEGCGVKRHVEQSIMQTPSKEASQHICVDGPP